MDTDISRARHRDRLNWWRMENTGVSFDEFIHAAAPTALVTSPRRELR